MVRRCNLGMPVPLPLPENETATAKNAALKEVHTSKGK